MPTTTDRSALIRANLGVSRSFSPAASAIVDHFQEICADARDLAPGEELRLLAEIQRQIAGRLVDLATR